MSTKDPSDKNVSDKNVPDKAVKNIPDICKACPNELFFQKEEGCNVYWEGKKDCASRFWLEKGR